MPRTTTPSGASQCAARPSCSSGSASRRSSPAWRGSPSCASGPPSGPRSRASTPRPSPGSPTTTSRACSRTPASCATGPRSTRPSLTPVRCSACGTPAAPSPIWSGRTHPHLGQPGSPPGRTCPPSRRSRSRWPARSRPPASASSAPRLPTRRCRPAGWWTTTWPPAPCRRSRLAEPNGGDLPHQIPDDPHVSVQPVHRQPRPVVGSDQLGSQDDLHPELLPELPAQRVLGGLPVVDLAAGELPLAAQPLRGLPPRGEQPARRQTPERLRGKWEFPGGKVDHGESTEHALRRELREELGVEVVLGSELVGPDDGTWRISHRHAMRLWLAVVSTGEPQPLVEHDELRWLGPG